MNRKNNFNIILANEPENGNKILRSTTVNALVQFVVTIIYIYMYVCYIRVGQWMNMHCENENICT